MKKLGLFLLVLLGAILVFGGCAKPAPAPTTAPAPKPTTAAPSPAPTVAALPKLLVMTAFPPATTSGAQAVALREAIQRGTGITVRMEPYEQHQAQVAALVRGEAQLAANTAVQAYTAISGGYEGVTNAQFRRVWGGDPFTATVSVRGDSGIKAIADLKGKRIPQSAGAVPWSQNIEAVLAFGGVTLKDVKVVQVSGTAAGIAALNEGTVDATLNQPFSAGPVELAAGPHGIYWFELPASDTAGWERLKKVVPWARPVETGAAGLEKGKTIPMMGYEADIWSTPQISDEVIYAVTKSLKEGYETYKNAHASLAKWTWERAYSLQGLLEVPFHPGAVKFFKEQGVWSAEHEKFQQNALKLEAERLGKK